MFQSVAIDEICKRGTIRASDVAALRTVYEASECMARDDAEVLFAVHAACPISAPAWSEFFIEAITEYVVHQATPQGYVVSENARWLTEHIAGFGQVDTSTELSLLVHIVECARWTPPSLTVLGLSQILNAVTTGTGPLRAGRPAEPGIILPPEVLLARRLIAAFGGDTNITVTRAEVDILVAINRAIGPGMSTPDWSDLFIRVVGSSVLAALGHAVPSRRDLVDPASSDTRQSQTIALFGSSDVMPSHAERQASGGIPGSGVRLWSTMPLLAPGERAMARLERQRLEIVTNEVVEEASDGWLIARLGEASRDDPNEIALLFYISRQATALPPELRAFASRAAKAA